MQTPTKRIKTDFLKLHTMFEVCNFKPVSTLIIFLSLSTINLTASNYLNLQPNQTTQPTADPIKTTVLFFDAQRTAEGITLSWRTEEQTDISEFSISKSMDGKSYNSITIERDIELESDTKIYSYTDVLTEEDLRETDMVYYKLSQPSSEGEPVVLATTSTTVAASTSPTGIQDLLPQSSPKSPNVSAMERYGNSPISLYTGQPNINIPIWDIKVGGMTVPIKLSYHPGGHKVLDNAPWTGMGWSLTGMYAITREQRGRADEVGGVFNQTLPNYSSPVTCLTEALKLELNDHINFDKDLERDLFTYRTPSKSNSFVFTPSDVLFLESDKSQVTYSPAPSLLGSITVNDENGNRYTYAEKESTFSNNQSSTSTWHLTELATNKPGQKLIYNYYPSEQFDYTTGLSYSRTYYTNVCGNAPVTGGFHSETTSDNTVTVHNKSPKEIFFPEGKIEFVQETANRQDGLGKALDIIKVYSYNFTTSSYTLIKQYDLEYVYKTRQGSSEKVLFLNKVKLLNTDDSVVGEYSLDYNTLALPGATSLSKDYWGYYNGASNTNLMPTESFQTLLNCNSGSTNFTLGSANRNASESNMQAWMLTRLNYPTGGFTDYTFEAHKYQDAQSNTVTVGGLRIKSMVSDDGNGNTETKLIKYGINESSYGTNRDLAKRVLRTDQKIKLVDAPSYPFDYNYNVVNFTAGVNTAVNPYESVVVTYPEVSVYEDINGLATNGKTVHTFKDDAFDNLITHPATNRQALQSEHWNRGQSLIVIHYGADGKKKKKISNTYTELVAASTTETIGYVFGKTEVRVNPFPPVGGCLVDDDVFNPLLKTMWISGLTRPVSSESWDYDDTDDSKFVYTLTESDYDPTYYQLIESTHHSSDGSVRLAEYRYCTNINGITASSTGHAAAIYQMMQNNELHRPIESIHKYKTSSSGAANVYNGQVILSKILSLDTYNYVIDDELHLLEVDPDDLFSTVSFTPLIGNGTGLQLDPKYEKRILFNSYDIYGNLKSFQQTTGSITSFSYNTAIDNGVYHRTVSTKKENDSGNSNYIDYLTSYSTPIPLLGPNQITAPNSVNTYFEFDLFGRLLRIKDHNQDILQEFEYNLVTGNRFVKTKTPREAMTSTTGKTHTQLETSVSYLDGLGRPLQNVHLKAHPNGINDIVSNAVSYDAFGRVDKSYMPFSGSGGALASLPSTIRGDTKPYSMVSTYDNSALDRPKVSLSPGALWHSNNKSINKVYETAPSNIRKYSLASATSVSTPSSYGANKLHMHTTTSEQGNNTIQYTDNEGKVVLVEQELDASNDALTYTIYDQYNRPKYIIQPNKFPTSTSFNESNTYFKEGVFAYTYDERGRVIASHEPGKGWTHFVYDRLDRLVLSQHSLQATADDWTYTKYDALGRTIESGELSTTRSHNQLQNDFASVSTSYEQWNTSTKQYTNQSYPSSLSSAINEVRIQNYYDSYSLGSAFPSGVSFDASLTNQSNFNNPKGLLTLSLSDNSVTHSMDYFRTYYYDFRDRLIETIEGHHLGGATASDNPLKSGTSYNFKGEVIAAKTNYNFDQLASHTIEEEYILDHKARVKEYKSGINTSPSSICTSTYDEANHLIQKTYYPGQNFTAGGGVDFIYRPPNPQELNTEDIARIAIILEPGTCIDTLLNGMPATYLAEVDTTMEDTKTLSALQTIDYSYNIRDWLTGINLNASGLPIPSSSQGDLFSLKLDYADALRYDGNVGKQSWRTKPDTIGPTTIRTYTYSYDKAKRLLSAIYNGPAGENNNVSGLSYDKNGNINTLQRYNAQGLMDNLSYTYNGNKLMKVEDAVPGDHNIDFVNKNAGSDDYDYHPDGCLKQDLNEDISDISYDTYLNKPTKVTLTTGETIEYIYNGEGTMIQRVLSDSTTWDYVGAMILNNNIPYQLSTTEGRAVYEEDDWHYEFEYRDHVGNLRMAFRDRDGSLQQTQASDYTPFGLQINNGVYNAKKDNFTYQAHEDMSDFDINMVGMQARCYNKTIGRFTAYDALSSVAPNWSGYRFAYDNPVNVTDPTGNLEATDGYGSLSATSFVGYQGFGFGDPYSVDDDYGLDKDGNIILLRKTDDDTDNLISLDKEGNETKISYQLQRGILNNVEESTTSSGTKFNYIKIKGDDFATKLFEFIAENSKVEWSQIKFGKSKNYLSTAHKKHSEAGGVHLMYKLTIGKYTVREHIHSHPTSTTGPSGFHLSHKGISGDRKYANWISKYNSKVKLKVYEIKTQKYIKFNNKGVIK